jgi:predicted O-methyltransferase YrrM
MKGIGFIKGILWFLKRPRFYPELFRTLKGFAFKRITSTDAAREAVHWCEGRAITTTDAIAKLFKTKMAEAICEKFKDVFAEAQKAVQTCPVRMGGAANLDLLYEIAENTGAKKVVETGVAYGWSSLALLLSLTTRENSMLVSTDMPYIDRNSIEHIGCVVPDQLRSCWKVITGPDRFALPQALEKLPSIDLCHYDSDKSYKGRIWAYNLLWKALKPGGYFISDDIGDNLAFRDFCKQIEKEPVIVQSPAEASRKYVGILVKNDFD